MINFLSKVDASEFKVPQGDLGQSSIETILQIVFAVVGLIALIVLLLASLKYIISRGDPQAVAKAKNTILYAVIGLVISASAFGIVGFVVNKL